MLEYFFILQMVYIEGQQKKFKSPTPTILLCIPPTVLDQCVI